MCGKIEEKETPENLSILEMQQFRVVARGSQNNIAPPIPSESMRLIVNAVNIEVIFFPTFYLPSRLWLGPPFVSPRILFFESSIV